MATNNDIYSAITSLVNNLNNIENRFTEVERQVRINTANILVLGELKQSVKDMNETVRHLDKSLHSFKFFNKVMGGIFTVIIAILGLIIAYFAMKAEQKQAEEVKKNVASFYFPSRNTHIDHYLFGNCANYDKDFL